MCICAFTGIKIKTKITCVHVSTFLINTGTLRKNYQFKITLQMARITI